MKKIILTLAAVLSLFVVNSRAAELTVQDCVTMALENNKDLKAFAMDVRSGQQELKIARTKFLPSWKMNANYNLKDKSDQFLYEADVFSPGIPPGDVEFSTENKDMYGLSLILEQPLFTGGNINHSYKKSKIMNEQRQLKVERQKKLLAFEVKKNFYTVIKEQGYREASEKTLQFQRGKLAILQERLKEGYIKKEDILQMETTIAFAEFDLAKSKNREDLARSRLKEIIYYEGDEKISLKAKPLAAIFTSSLLQVKETALLNREELKISLLNIKTAEEELKIVKSDFYPQVSLQGSYTLQRENPITRPQVWEIGTRINWPIFEWGRTRAQVLRVRAVRQKSIYQHEQLKKNIVLEVEEIWRALKDKEGLIQAHEKKFKTTEYRLSLLKEQYSEGKAKLIDIAEMEAEVKKSHADYLAAVSDLNIQRAYLEAAASSPLNLSAYTHTNQKK